ncbi:MAG: aa3-type cytochrome c oxidase subunit IV [Pseudomonadota bacterium]
MADNELEPYVPGSMDITAQEKTFEGFLQVALGVVIVTFVILIFLAIVGT